MAEEGKPRRPEKVSKDELANEIVELLRQAAHKIIELGDRRAMAENEVTSLQRQLATMDERWALAQSHEEEFEEWQELLLNLRSGIADVGEVLAGTVGAP